MDARQLFVDVVSSAADVPAELRVHAADVRGCKQSSFDESYIDFLDTQIRLGARGPEWTERLAKRRAGLLPYCGATLISGRIRSPASEYTVYVDTGSRSVVYWEVYELDGG
jgi:hypothetical protein